MRNGNGNGNGDLFTSRVSEVSELVEADFSHINDLRNTVLHCRCGIIPRDLKLRLYWFLTRVDLYYQPELARFETPRNR